MSSSPISPHAAYQPGGNTVRIGLEDDSAFAQLVTRPVGSGRREFELNIPDMRCASCATRVEDALLGLRYIDHIRINPARQHVLLEYDPDHVTLGNIIDAVADAGYTPVPGPCATDDPALLRERRQQLKRLGVAGIGMIQVMMFSVALYAGAIQDMTPFYESLFRWIAMAFTTPVVLYSATPFFRGAVASTRAWLHPTSGARSGLAMDVPVALALGIAFSASVIATLRGTGQVYFDSVTMFTFLLLGARLLEQGSRLRLAQLDNWLAMLPESVSVEREQQRLSVPIESVRAGDLVFVTTGARIPVDGVITVGTTSIDESALTGESQAHPRQAGDALFAGTMNIGQPITLTATAAVGDTRMAAIHRLAQRAALEKTPAALLADTVARYFVVGIVILAGATWLAWQFIDPLRALSATIAVLVVSCPCALSLATPVAITAAATALRRVGFVATRAHTIERLADIDLIVFDKTGTLTGGKPELLAVEPLHDLSADTCVKIAASLEDLTQHPLAPAFGESAAGLITHDVHIHQGQGISARIDGAKYLLGSAEFCHIHRPPRDVRYTTIYLVRVSSDASGFTPLAEFTIRLGLRPDAAATLSALRELGVKAEILSGDSAAPTEEISDLLGHLPFRAQMSPEAKLEHLRQLAQRGATVAMIGDGINDVPGFAAAAVSIAPADATDLAKARSDAVLVGRGLGALPWAIRIARKARRIIRQNLTWAVVYNLVAIPLAAAGLMPPWAAAIGMSLSSLGVTTNAVRLSRLRVR